MAPRHVPERDRDQVELIRSFRPSGSATVVSLWDVGEDARLPMLRWGDSIYIPVYEGMRLAVDVYNGRDRMIAIPTFIEGANLWVGGPSTPEACAPSHMWEIQPHQVMRVDALMNPEGQRGRPIVITQTGIGATVGEATFGTDAYRGQLRIFERMPIGQETLGPMVPPAQGRARRASDDEERTLAGSVDLMALEEAASAPFQGPPPGYAIDERVPAATLADDAPAAAMPHAPAAAPAPSAAPGGAFRQAPPPPAMSAYARPAPKATKARGQAGFGAAEEEARQHYFTGINYHPEAAQVVALRTEFREDIEAMIRASMGASWSWRWPPAWNAEWIADPWMWPVAPTAPHIPVTRPRG